MKFSITSVAFFATVLSINAYLAASAPRLGPNDLADSELNLENIKYQIRQPIKEQYDDEESFARRVLPVSISLL